MSQRQKLAPPWVHMFYIGLYLERTWNYLLGLDPWYLVCIASPNGPLPSLFKLCLALHQGHMFYIGSYRENMKKTSCLKTLCQEPWYLVCSITKWPFTKFVQIMSLWSKLAPLGIHIFYPGLYRENIKKSAFLKPHGLVGWCLMCKLA